MPKAKEKTNVVTTNADEQGIVVTGAEDQPLKSEADVAALAEIEQTAKANLEAKGEVTFKQAAQYTGFPESKVRTAIKTHDAFKAEGAVNKREIEGTDFSITYIRVDALQAWMAALDAKGNAGVSRVKAEGTKYTLFVKPEHYDQIVAFIAPMGYTLEKAYKGSKATKAEGASPAPVTTAEQVESTEGEATMADLFEGETVKA